MYTKNVPWLALFGPNQNTVNFYWFGADPILFDNFQEFKALTTNLHVCKVSLIIGVGVAIITYYNTVIKQPWDPVCQLVTIHPFS